MIHGAELRVHFLKSFQKGSTCENLSQKGLKIKKVGRVDYWTVVVVGLWPAVCFAIGLLWPVADWLWPVGAHVLCFCLLPVG
jgi:membrane protein YdbS with pleckstrin-like domain